MENNLKFIKTFPNKIKKINIKQIEEHKNLGKLNIKKLQTITINKDNYLLAHVDNMIYILDSNYEIINKLYSSGDDNLKNFGYCIFENDKYLFVVDLLKKHFH